jgi:hypothetical protein
MIVAGFLLAFGSVLPVFSLFGAAGDFVGGAVSGAARGKGPEARVVTGFVDAVQGRVFQTVAMALGGAGLIVVGALVRRAGSHGLAGSGLVLDPERAREDVRPWSRMQGGVLRDTLDGAGLTPPPASRPSGGALPFDEKLRRLHRLREEGLLSEEEYQRERKEVLDSS